MPRNTHSRSTRPVPRKKPLRISPASVKTEPVIAEAPDPILQLPQEVKKILHVEMFPSDYPSLNSMQSISDFCLMLHNVVPRYESNSQIIFNADAKIQDLLHEIELLPAVNVKNGYLYYKQLRTERRKRRIAKSENTTLLPLYEYIESYPDFLAGMDLLNESCKAADSAVNNQSYIYRLQEAER